MAARLAAVSLTSNAPTGTRGRSARGAGLPAVASRRRRGAAAARGSDLDWLINRKVRG
jgi:hypothetical protein